MNIYDISEKYEDMKRSAVRHSAMQLSDNTRLVAEDCTGIELFDENTVKLRLGFGVATITGLDLRMSNFSAGGVIITGRIHSIGFEEKERGGEKI